MDQFFLEVKDVTVRLGGMTILDAVCLGIKANEQWAITGPSGSGKTVLAETIAGKHFYSGSLKADFGEPENFQRLVFLIPQQHRFRNLQNRSDFYYQQRYQSSDSQQTITVRQALDPYWPQKGEQASGYEVNALLDWLKLQPLLDENLIQLSNGENKRLQIMRALLQKHELLILDQPFVGLDLKGRELLHEILNDLHSRNLKFLLICSEEEMPSCITHVARLEGGKLQVEMPPTRQAENKKETPVYGMLHEWQTLLRPAAVDFENAVRMEHVCIQYDNKIILDDINWTLGRAECWSVSGPNGAGKSTLLSLIAADNPQAYANEIYLFDRRRGTGESIWDIKKRIGYLSPELHLYFDSGATVFQALASGLFDTIGLFRKLTEEQEYLVLQWIEKMQLKSKMNRLISGLSAGEQRWVLLARALIKNPPLLILDEPCQGLDSAQSALFREMVNLSAKNTRASVIYVSHYEKDIPSCVTKFLRLEKGKRIS